MPDDFILIKGRTLALNGLIGQNVQWFPHYVGQFHEMVEQCGRPTDILRLEFELGVGDKHPPTGLHSNVIDIKLLLCFSSLLSPLTKHFITNSEL